MSSSYSGRTTSRETLDQHKHQHEYQDPTPTEEPRVTASDRAVSIAHAVAEAAADKLASDIVIIDVSDRLVITDCFVLASAPNDRQVRAVVDEVEERLRRQGVKPVRREGE